MRGSDPKSRRCPECGRGDLLEISYREGSGAADVPIQESDTRQVESYSCGHEIAGPALDRSAAGTEGLQVERRHSEETPDPL